MQRHKLMVIAQSLLQTPRAEREDRFIKPGMTVVDLGSAPGGWSQVAAQLVGHKGRVIASDILPMDAIAGVDFIQGDFTEQSVFDEIQAVIGTDQPSVVCPMAPNMRALSMLISPKPCIWLNLRSISLFRCSRRVVSSRQKFFTGKALMTG